MLLEIELNPFEIDENSLLEKTNIETIVCKSNFKYMYWNMSQDRSNPQLLSC